jgi:NADPH:quinone reductase-like Zn-dependent oxidoreductase
VTDSARFHFSFSHFTKKDDTVKMLLIPTSLLAFLLFLCCLLSSIYAIHMMSSSDTSSRQIPPLMRTIVYGKTVGSYALRHEVTVPKPKKNQILVRVHAVGLNPVDAKGVIGDKLPRWDKLRNVVHEHAVKGHIPGFDFAGTVVDASQSSFAVGTAVFGTMPPLQGTLAEYIAVPLDQVWEMPVKSATTPTSADFVNAAALPLVGLTGLQCLQPHLENLPSVLVLGASGGTGHVMLQIAQCLGARHVTAVCSAKNFDFCEENGATDVIDYHEPELMKKLQEASGCPYDFVMDCVTSEVPRDKDKVHYPTLLQEQKDSLLSPNYVYRRLGGATSDWIRASLQRVVSGGAGGPKGSFFWWRLGAASSNEQLFWVRFHQTCHELEQLAQWVKEGKLKPSVQEVYPFSEKGVQSAMDAILSRRVRGKVVVQIYPQLSEQEV